MKVLYFYKKICELRCCWWIDKTWQWLWTHKSVVDYESWKAGKCFRHFHFPHTYTSYAGDSTKVQTEWCKFSTIDGERRRRVRLRTKRFTNMRRFFLLFNSKTTSVDCRLLPEQVVRTKKRKFIGFSSWKYKFVVFVPKFVINSRKFISFSNKRNKKCESRWNFSQNPQLKVDLNILFIIRHFIYFVNNSSDNSKINKLICSQRKFPFVSVNYDFKKHFLLTKIFFLYSSYSEPISSSNCEPSSEELIMSSGNKRTYSTSSNSSVMSSSFCVTLGVGPLWCSWCNYKRENGSR